MTYITYFLVFITNPQMWTSRLLNNTIRKIIPSTSMKPSITDTTITPITLHSGSFTFGGGTILLIIDISSMEFDDICFTFLCRLMFVHVKLCCFLTHQFIGFATDESLDRMDAVHSKIMVLADPSSSKRPGFIIDLLS